MNMLRFILDCLRPARARAAAATRDTELEAQVNTSHDNEIKGLQDEVHMEQETLQTIKALCRNTQETVEMLEERKTQLKEELKMIYDLQKQEKEVLQSLQEEQQELEQTVQQYDMELCAAAEDLLQLQREVAYAKAHAESLHLRITPLQDLFEEIIQVKKKLAELVAGLIAGESSVAEMTEDDPCAVLDQELEGSMDIVESECDHVYSEKSNAKPGGEELNDVEQENAVEELDKMQYSMENLKSSGSSSFTEITLTEVKEEDVMFRSTTPQSDSSDIEKEDFEIIQPCQVTNRQFDFFHPNPFTDGDVFGDEHFPKVDVTEQLSRDPFKGTDPFASDALLVNMPEEERCEDELIPAEDSLPETKLYPRQSVIKDYGTFNTPVNMPPDADCTQSSGKRDSGVSMSTESRSLKSGSDVDYEFETNATQDQNDDAVQPDQLNEAASPQFNEECFHDSDSSHSSTVFNSIEADSNVFVEEEEDRVDVQAESGLRVNSLCGLQSIIAGSYTGFPLSPCEPDPLPGDFQKTFEHHIIASEQNAANGKELGNTESSSPDNTPGPLGEQLHDKNSNPSSSPCASPSQPSALDEYDYKYGDMFFFTVRLDPGSPELHNQSPVCPEPNDVKKDESNASLSPEFNDVDELECSSPKPEDTEQHNEITNHQNEIAANSDSPKHDETLVPDSETVVLHIPSFTFEDSDACQSVLDSEWDDQWTTSPDVAEPVPDSSIQDTESNRQILSPESSSSQNKPSCSEGSAMSNLELQYFDPFSPIPTEPIKGVSDLEELNTVNSFCHEAPRLDSGYHEVGTPTPFSPEPADKSKCSIDLQCPGLETRKQSNSEIHVPDPFSPESVDTGIFDSETENYESGYMITKCQLLNPQPVYTDLNNLEEKQISVSYDVLSDHLSGSEHDDCYPFGSCPSNEESYAYSYEEKLIDPIREASDGESKPSSIVSNASDSSQVFQSVWGNSEMSFPNPEVLDNVFDFNTSDFGLFEANVSQEAEEDTHCAGKAVKNADLAEIDYFCSELSKMVSSSSSDSVQQSVAEMLFGSDPNTTSFYPWDFEKPQHSC
ncbi:hypothetical protein QQF64_014337 [Cirrhinus molitorella]|uniref:Epidermal growth factor receptor substrate 15 n=1 Tax=Cirrhinus molitorella TaxID=172907 RepID=A0ABR3NRS5_9TELE